MILVTGGAGFTGTNFVLDWLAASEEGVVNLDKLTYAGHRDNLAALDGDARHVFVQGDIADGELVARLLREHRPRAIVHLAAESHVDRSIAGPRDFVHTNVLGTAHLLETVRAYWSGLAGAQRDAFRFLHVSTDEVYGSLAAQAPAFTEQHRFEPNSPYAASKAGADHLVRAWNHTWGLPTLSTHCSNNYGPFQVPEKLIPRTVANALAGQELPVYGDGRQVRDWIYVGDHCAALRTVLAAGQPGRSYNIGAGNELRNVDMVGAICAVLDRHRPLPGSRSYRAQIRHVQDRLGHDRRYAVDTSRIRQELGWTPAAAFEQALERTVRWYLDHPSWVQRAMQGLRPGEVA